jgi:cytoskeletal protein RodZ
MKSLGKYLQGERLARGISLEQISTDTRISMSMLQAIEEGNTEKLPASVLVKGFLRAYAGKIGLDPEAVILQYQDLLEEMDVRQEDLEKFHQRLRPESSRKKWIAPSVTLALVIGLAALLLWLIREPPQESRLPDTAEVSPAVEAPPSSPESDSTAEPGHDQTADRPQKLPTPPIAEPAPEPAGPDFEGPVSDAPPAGEEVSTPLQPSVPQIPELEQQAGADSFLASEYILRAEVLERTWLRVIIDESREREYLLQSGEVHHWRAASGFKLIIGNAAGVKLYLNDKPLEPLGERGKVIHLELPNPSLLMQSDTQQAE